MVQTFPDSFPPPSLCRHGRFGKEAETTRSEWNREHLGSEKTSNTSSFISATAASISCAKKGFKTELTNKNPKHSIFHLTSWPGSLLVTEAGVVSDQLTKFLSGLSFCMHTKNCGICYPSPGWWTFPFWKGLWSLMSLTMFSSGQDNHWSGQLHYQFEKLLLSEMIWGESERGQ